MEVINSQITAVRQLANTIGSEIQRGIGEQRLLTAQLDAHQRAASSLTSEAELLEQVVSLLGAMAETFAAKFETAVGEVVSRGLTGVFGEELNLVVELGQSGDLPTARFAVRDSRGLETDVIDARGGGLVNVASFLLRVLLLLSARPALSRILLLDEPMGNVSKEYRPAVTELLRRMADEAQIQILMVSHSDDLTDAADVVYRFALEDGVTVVKRERSESEAIAEG